MYKHSKDNLEAGAVIAVIAAIIYFIYKLFIN
jgi:hypothetical protein